MSSKFQLIRPHGGTLINRVLSGEARQEAAQCAESLLKIPLNDLNLADLEMIAGGGLSPLTGFMGQADYQSVVHNMRLANGLPWTIPVTLAVAKELADGINIGQEVALFEQTEAGPRTLAVLTVEEKYTYDK